MIDFLPFKHRLQGNYVENHISSAGLIELMPRNQQRTNEHFMNIEHIHLRLID
jgi:hypothetical protein